MCRRFLSFVPTFPVMDGNSFSSLNHYAVDYITTLVFPSHSSCRRASPGPTEMSTYPYFQNAAQPNALSNGADYSMSRRIDYLQENSFNASKNTAHGLVSEPADAFGNPSYRSSVPPSSLVSSPVDGPHDALGNSFSNDTTSIMPYGISNPQEQTSKATTNVPSGSLGFPATPMPTYPSTYDGAMYGHEFPPNSFVQPGSVFGSHQVFLESLVSTSL